MTTLDLWTQAKYNVPRCERCEDWNKRGLSSTCPECDKLILEEHDRLQEIQNDPIGLGVLFETGSAKFIKSTDSSNFAPAQFVSSWDQGSQFEYSKWKADPDSILDQMECLPYKSTIRFISAALFYRKDQ